MPTTTAVHAIRQSQAPFDLSSPFDVPSILDASVLYEHSEMQVWRPTATIQATSVVSAPYSRYVDLIIASCLVSNRLVNDTNSPSILSDLFVYKDFWAVSNYLRGKTQLRDLLLETYFKLGEYFDNEPQFVLEIARDVYEPESDELYLSVISRNSIEADLKSLERFESEWWYERTGYFIGSPVVILG